MKKIHLFYILFIAASLTCVGCGKSGTDETSSGSGSGAGNQSSSQSDGPGHGGNNNNNSNNDNNTPSTFVPQSCTRTEECANEGEVCKSGQCVDLSGKTDLCKTGQLKCGQDQRCENNACKPNCDFPCGDVCCGDGKVCHYETQVCYDACPGTDKNRCGASAVCCASDEACIGGSCTKLGTACNTGEDFCPISSYCHEGFSQCVKYADTKDVCLYKTTEKFEPQVKLHWHKSKVHPGYHNIMSTPAVADVSGDGIPDIIFNTFDFPRLRIFLTSDPDNAPGVLRVISGKAGKNPEDVTEHWNSTDLGTESFWAAGSNSPAVGDLNRDGKLEIAVLYNNKEGDPSQQGLRLVEGKTGKTIWKTSKVEYKQSAAISLANLDRTGWAEILVSKYVIDGETGEILCEFPSTEANLIPVAADLDNQGNMEIILGHRTYSYTRDPVTKKATCSLRPSNPGKSPAEYPEAPRSLALTAVADILPSTPGPEIVVVDKGWLYLRDSNGKLIDKTQLSRYYLNRNGGAPTIADFDGDDELEIGIANADFYFVFEVENGKLKEKWRYRSQDNTSGITGSSVFDFDGDGAAEVVYNDETAIRIFDGNKQGLVAPDDVKFKQENPNFTLIENPVIVDVDKDGHADIIAVASWDGTLGASKTRGLRVLTDAKNRWVPTRSIWNQHAYHYTNVEDDGKIPLHEKNHWEKAWSNNFRQNVQEGTNRFAPDVQVKIGKLYDDTCTAEANRAINYRITNVGDASVQPHTFETAVYVSEHGKNQYTEVSRGWNTKVLKPNEYEEVSFEWAVPSEYANKSLDIKVVTDPDNSLLECNDDNNSDEVKNVTVSAPNLKPILSSVVSAQCLVDNSIVINFDVHNHGGLSVDADTFTINVYAGEKGKATLVHSFKNTTEIAPNAHESFTYKWPLDNTLYNKELDIFIKVDEEDKVTECNEEDNEIVETNARCFVLG